MLHRVKSLFSKKTFRVTIACFVGAGIAVAILIGSRSSHTYKIPSTIKNQLSFPVLFLEDPVAGYSVDTSSVKYAHLDKNTGILSFIIKTPSNQITIAEQAYPEILIYDKLTNSVQPYSEVGTLYGKLTLGRPKDSGGQQAAVLKYGDATLIFAKPIHDLSDSDWRQLFNSFNQIR